MGFDLESNNSTEGFVMSEVWLRCAVFHGVFSDEVAVRVLPKEGEAIAFVVARSQVVGDPDHDGKVRVRLYRKGRSVWAELPTENRAVIPVDEANLVPT